MPTGCYIKKDDISERMYDVICANCGNVVWYATGKSLQSAKKTAEKTMSITGLTKCKKCGSSLADDGKCDASV